AVCQALRLAPMTLFELTGVAADAPRDNVVSFGKSTAQERRRREHVAITSGGTAQFRTSQRTPQPARARSALALRSRLATSARQSWNAKDLVERSVHDIPLGVGDRRRLA